MKAALEAPNTPSHLREHLAATLTSLGVTIEDHTWKVLGEEDAEPFRVLSEESMPQKGERLKLPGSGYGTVMFVHPKQNIVRIKTDDGKQLTIGPGSSLGARFFSDDQISNPERYTSNTTSMNRRQRLLAK